MPANIAIIPLVRAHGASEMKTGKSDGKTPKSGGFRQVKQCLRDFNS
jgi:hypothetical protein